MPQYNYRMPSLGADMDSATLVEWLVKPGDAVKKGQDVVMLQTEKAALEGEIWVDGIVRELKVQPGEKVPVGTALAIIEVEKEIVEQVPNYPQPALDRSVEATIASTSPAPKISGDRRVRASPAARQRASMLGIDLLTLSGSGPGGIISIEDVERASATRKTAPGGEMRQAIARLMSRSKREIPHYYLETQLELDEGLKFLGAQNEKLPVTERILPITLILRAITVALQRVPELNGYWINDGLRTETCVHLGFAVAVKNQGLIAPAIQNADQKSVPELMQHIQGLVQRARTGALKVSDLAEPTITVTSLGDQGVESIFGVIYPPQVALIGLGMLHKAAIIKDDSLQIGSVMQASLSADHRASDGHRGALFLAEVKRLLKKPEKLWSLPGATN